MGEERLKCIKCGVMFEQTNKWNAELCANCSQEYVALIKTIKEASMWHDHERAYQGLEFLLERWTLTLKQIMIYADIAAIDSNCPCGKAIRQLPLLEESLEVKRGNYANKENS